MQLRGKQSGDGECWYFQVEREEYRKVFGEEAYQEKLKDEELENEFLKFCNQDENFAKSKKPYFAVYPNEIFEKIGAERDEELTVEINLIDDHRLEIYSEPVDNETLEFIKKCQE